MTRIKYFLLVWLAVMLPVIYTGCKNSDDPTESGNGGFDVEFQLPSSIVAARNADYLFNATPGKAALTSDMMMLESTSGISYETPITASDENSFKVAFPSTLSEGTYRVHIKRGTRRKSFGLTSIRVVDRIIDSENGSTVFGVISTPDGTGVKDVIVSDGAEIVTTDSDGVYQLKSTKQLGYVFITLPSGYEAVANGVFPRIFEQTKMPEAVPERIDFTITPVSGQENHKVLFLGDMHLANRTGDLNQFDELVADVNAYRSAHSGEKVYGITLGDMTWDIYWYSKQFGFTEYIDLINKKVNGLQIFHTIGNHDNDYLALNNKDAKLTFRTKVAPNYYSFNIGKVHYVILDDIDCSTYDGTESRLYVERLVSEQLTWLAKDLSYVDKTTPVVIAMHAPMFKPNGATQFAPSIENASELMSIIDGYKVHFVTGHTHKNYNVTPSHSVTNGAPIYEHNVAAICGDWWWSGYLSPGYLMAPDGTPAGFAIWNIAGTDFSYIYKGTGMSTEAQFRSYDLNNVSFSFDDVPNLSASATTARNSFQRYITAYPDKESNEILINIWNYNPSWTVTVTTQDGTNLPVTQQLAYDPLHIKAMAVKRFNEAGITSTPNFITQNYPHFFKATAPDADTDVIITVKDEFGNVWTENMARPKAFTLDNYKFK